MDHTVVSVGIVALFLIADILYTRHKYNVVMTALEYQRDINISQDLINNEVLTYLDKGGIIAKVNKVIDKEVAKANVKKD